MTDDLLELGEAVLLADISHADLLRAIETRRLPAVRLRREPGAESWGEKSILRIRRADLERFAGSRFHGGRGHEGFDILSVCSTGGCDRYARGGRCDRHGGSAEPLNRELRRVEKTSYHEAAHAIAARELGWTVRSVSIVGDFNSHGELLADGPLSTSLDVIRDELAVRLAGPLGVALASREDWRKLKLDSARAAEEPGPFYFAEAAQAARFGADRRAAFDWVEEATATAGERACDILERSWADVAHLAITLMRKGTITL